MITGADFIINHEHNKMDTFQWNVICKGSVVKIIKTNDIYDFRQHVLLIRPFRSKYILSSNTRWFKYDRH